MKAGSVLFSARSVMARLLVSLVCAMAAASAASAHTARMVIAPNPASVGTPVTFDGSGSTAGYPGIGCPFESIDDWQWDLDGDGSIDKSGETIQHVYAHGGAYRVSLTVQQHDATWCGSDTTTQTLSVLQPGAQPPENTSAPTITGDAAVGQALLAEPGSWSGTTPMLFDYQWQRCDSTGSSCKAIAGARDDSYTVAKDDVGFTLRVAVTAANGGGFSEPASSPPTGVVPSPPPPPLIPPPCDPDAPEDTVLGDENEQQCVATGPPSDQPSNYVGDDQPNDLIDDSVDEPSSGFFPIFEDGSSAAGVPWSNQSRNEAESAAAAGGLPSDCIGKANPAWFDKDDKLIRGQGEVKCKKPAFITIEVCIAVKKFGVSIFSVYDDVSCHKPATSFGRKRKTGKSIYCLSGTHKYRTHVRIWIERGAKKGYGEGYQRGRLKVTC